MKISIRIRRELKISYERYRYKCELEVIEKLDEDPGALYRYARKKSVIREEWCPQFLSQTGGCGPVRVYTVM